MRLLVTLAVVPVSGILSLASGTPRSKLLEYPTLTIPLLINSA